MTDVPLFRRQISGMENYTGGENNVLAGPTAARATELQSMCIHHINTQRAFYFPVPYAAPYATIQAVDTEYDFIIPGMTNTTKLQLPWYQHLGADTLKISVIFGVKRAATGLRVRATSDTLVDSITGQETYASIPQYLGQTKNTMWGVTEYKSIYKAGMYFNSPSTENRFTIGFKCMISGATQPPTTGTQKYWVRIQSITVQDRHFTTGVAP